jgi:hypothetical protein
VRPTNPLQRSAPPAPSRVRLIRPGFYRSEATGALSPDVRDLLIGLTTMADDEGWILWQPAEIAAGLYAYAPATRRLRDIARRSTRLIEAGLLLVNDCGCALLPTLKEHHAVKGGVKSTGIWAWHQGHSVALRSPKDTSVSDSGSVTASSSSSVKDSGASSSGAREAAPQDGATCVLCRRPTAVHALNCPDAPHLKAVG